MKNIITATIEFYFKGEKFTPSITIDLDAHMQSGGCLPNLHALIAIENKIDLYSYEYEMMLPEMITITKSEGLISDFIENNILNAEAFEKVWKERQILSEVTEIVEKNMDINDLQDHPELKQTLLEVYQLASKNQTT